MMFKAVVQQTVIIYMPGARGIRQNITQSDDSNIFPNPPSPRLQYG